MNKKQQVRIPKEIQARRKELLRQLAEVADDPERRALAEELHKKISALSAEDLLRPFTI